MERKAGLSRGSEWEPSYELEIARCWHEMLAQNAGL